MTMSLSKLILAVIALGAFAGAYGNFMFALILRQDSTMWTLMVWPFQLQQFAAQEVVFAPVLVAAVPTLLVFVFCRNLIIRGIVVPSTKWRCREPVGILRPKVRPARLPRASMTLAARMGLV